MLKMREASEETEERNREKPTVSVTHGTAGAGGRELEVVLVRWTSK
jgi:hypothetical protein